MTTLQWLFVAWATFVVAGCTCLFIWKAGKKRALLSWPETEGEILTAEIRRGRNIYSTLSGPIWYIPHFTYRYAVEGRTYIGKRLYYFSDTEAFRSHVANRIVAERPVGARVPVYYDPKDHASSVLERRPLPHS